jgi:lipopolysaccharide/colanic/teichoic acid biosynthesis glycosyltransferase
VYQRIGKRAFDVLLALLLAILLALPVLCLISVLAVLQGRPIFHSSVRMRSPNQTFVLWKFRTMHVAGSRDTPSGGHSFARMTTLGKTLRRHRLDEVPQLWNVLKGDMSFVGPRPPLPEYVTRNQQLFAQLLRCRPGLTGLATLHYHPHEERLLSACRTAEETEAVYLRRCMPRKARLDLIYLKHLSLSLDAYLLFATVRHLFAPKLSAVLRPSNRLNGISTTLAAH